MATAKLYQVGLIIHLSLRLQRRTPYKLVTHSGSMSTANPLTVNMQDATILSTSTTVQRFIHSYTNQSVNQNIQNTRRNKSKSKCSASPSHYAGGPAVQEHEAYVLGSRNPSSACERDTQTDRWSRTATQRPPIPAAAEINPNKPMGDGAHRDSRPS